jgi:hypothetical protein
MNHVDKSRFVKNIISILGGSNSLVHNHILFSENNNYLVF